MKLQLDKVGLSDFTNPIDLIADCHRRIEYFLGVLHATGVVYTDRTLDAQAVRTLVAGLDYFRQILPNHRADEEQSLFPRLQEQLGRDDADLQSLMDQMTKEHLSLVDLHGKIDAIAAKWLEDGRIPAAQNMRLLSYLDQLKIEYAKHFRAEEEIIFPFAKKTLDDRAMAKIADEMQQRRGEVTRGKSFLSLLKRMTG